MSVRGGVGVDELANQARCGSRETGKMAVKREFLKLQMFTEQK
jgi:hypothetical protein